MRIIHFDKESQTIKLKPETLEDLWHTERVLSPGDYVASKTTRSFKSADGRVLEKKDVYVQVEAEKIEFSEHANRVRVTGKIIAGGPVEYIQLGVHHTLDLELDYVYELKKPLGWKPHELDRLYDAQKEAHKPRVGIVLVEEETANFAVMKAYSVGFLFSINSHASKKDPRFEQERKKYYDEIYAGLLRLPVNRILLAGPGFTKDNLKKYIAGKNPDLLKKIHLAHCSTAEQSGANELMKEGLVEDVLGEERIAREFSFLQKLLNSISKNDGLSAYGIEAVKSASQFSAIDMLLVTDDFIRTNSDASAILDELQKLHTQFLIYSATSEAGKQLAGFGIAALLKFKVK